MAKTRRGTTLLSAVVAILMAFSIGFAPAAMPAAAYAQEAQSAAVSDIKGTEAKEEQKASEASRSKAQVKEDAKTEEHGDKNDGTDEASRSAQDKGDDGDDEEPKGPIEVVGDFFVGIVDGIKAAGSVVLNAITLTVDSVIKGIQGANSVENADGYGLKPAVKVVWDDNNDAAGARPTSPITVYVMCANEDYTMMNDLGSFECDFEGSDDKTLFVGADDSTYPSIGSMYTYPYYDNAQDYLYSYNYSVGGVPEGYSIVIAGSSEAEIVDGYYVQVCYLQYSDPYNCEIDVNGFKPKVVIDWSSFEWEDGATLPSETTFEITAYDENGDELSAYSRSVSYGNGDMTLLDNNTYMWVYEDSTLPACGESGVHHYNITTPSTPDSNCSISRNGYEQETDWTDPENPIVTGYYRITYNGSWNGSSSGGDPAPAAAVISTGKPAVQVSWAYFNDGSGNPLPALSDFQIVSYDSNGDQINSYTVSSSDSGWDKSGNDGYLWVYRADDLPECGSDGVDHYEIPGLYGECVFTCMGYSQEQVNLTDYYLVLYEATSNSGSDPGYEPGPSWNPNGSTGSPVLQVSVLGGNGVGLGGITVTDAATAYPIVDSTGTRGTGVPFTITVDEGGNYSVDLSGLDPVDNTNIYGYEFDMPVIANYTLCGPECNGGDGNSIYYWCRYDYDPSPAGLKPALKLVWNDNSNPDRPALLDTWTIAAYDEGGAPISGVSDTFAPSGSGDTWVITFDSMPEYGTANLGDQSDQTIANTKSGYEFIWSSVPRFYNIRSELPEVDANYYYVTYHLDYNAPTLRSDPTVRVKWIDKGHTGDRPASVTVGLYDGNVANDFSVALDTYSMTGGSNDLYWEHTFSGYPAMNGDYVYDYNFGLDINEISYDTTPYYAPWGGNWTTYYDSNNNPYDVFEIVLYHENGPDPYDWAPYVAHSDPHIIVWWWDEWWGLTQPAYLDVTLYDNGVAQETKQITPNYHGETQATYHGDWQASFPGHPDALVEQGHDYSFSIAFPDGYSVPGYDLLPTHNGWDELDWKSDYRTDDERLSGMDWQTSGYWDNWSIFAVPTTTTYDLTRSDTTGDCSGDTVDLEIEVTLPANAGGNRKYLLAPELASNANYQMSVTDENSAPVSVASAAPDVVASSPIVMTYNAPLNDGDTLSLNLIKGSSVSVRKAGSSPSISKLSGTGTQSGDTISFDVGNTALDTTVIEATNSGDSGDEPGGDPSPGVTTEGSITIAQNSMNSNTTYDAYQVFTGPVTTDNGQDKASTLSWAVGPTTQAAIISFLNDNGYQTWLAGAGNANAGLANNPMLAAQFISEKIADTTASPTAVAASGTQPRTTTGDSFASGLARILVQYGTPEANDATAGTAYQNDQGYYLFVTDTSTIDGTGHEAGTAPIWAPITNTARVVTEKTEIPTLTSQVTDDDTATPGKAADGNIGQDLAHTLTATMPANVMAYPSYAMTVTESLPSGMSLASNDTSSVAVTLGGVDITNMCGIDYANDVLTVSASNLRSSDVASALATQGVEFGPDATMVITYNAHLDADAEVGPDGNMTGAVLTYTADPNAESSPTSQAPQQNTYTYANIISLEKLDRETRLALAGVPFTIQDNASGKYVAADGTLSNSAVTHTTASNTGLIEISGVDSGTYTITEGTPVSGYKALASPITLTITPTYDATGALTGYGVSASGENFSAVVAPATTVGANEDGVSINDSTLMKAGVRVSNLREIVLPLTGMPLGMGIAVYGSILLAISLAVYVRNKRIKDQIAELEELGE